MQASKGIGELPSDVRVSLDALRCIVRELRASSRLAEKLTGLSGAQLFVLQQLAERPARTMGELAERTFTHQSSVSVVVRRLVERGLVARIPSEEDARRVAIELTTAGRALLRRAPRMTQETLISTILGLPTERRHQLARSLGALVSAMGIGENAPGLFFEDGAPQPEQPESTRRRPSRR